MAQSPRSAKKPKPLVKKTSRSHAKKPKHVPKDTEQEIHQEDLTRVHDIQILHSNIVKSLENSRQNLLFNKKTIESILDEFPKTQYSFY